ncbi:hypothetical protein Cocul_01639 [Corynebacterium oculi]|uniref:Uncharacterized protein n=1 Tax=Corynebacterium oculi TaxID=1544416 RepID=A0A0Q0UBH2_9CORY|nr:hypothetical protein Cocul_01639 [Corynebacterium oculi]
MTWMELSQHPRHGLGSESIPKKSIRPAVPEKFSDQDKFRVYRHLGNLPMAGVKMKNVYYVLWIEKEYGELYEH